MNQTTWDSPVRIRDPKTDQTRTVQTIRDAQAALGRDWPGRNGSQHGRAVKICDEAISGRRDPIEARRAFIAAAVEAHFQIH